MSGHSKWSTIKRKKGAADAKRGAVFTQVSKDITLSSREGGGDPEMNPTLRLAIKKAKAVNMPSANIERAINKGIGNLPGVKYENYIYEGYGPGGVAIMMDIITDNKNRSVAEIRHILSKYSGNLGENGSVSWMFDKRGLIILASTSNDEDIIFEAIIDAGAEDFQLSEDIYLISTGKDNLMEVRDYLEDLGYDVKSAEIDMVPKVTQKCNEKESDLNLKLLDALEDNDDVNKLYTNFELS